MKKGEGWQGDNGGDGDDLVYVGDGEGGLWLQVTPLSLRRGRRGFVHLLQVLQGWDWAGSGAGAFDDILATCEGTEGYQRTR